MTGLIILLIVTVSLWVTVLVIAIYNLWKLFKDK
jgi:hypothetical protein